MDNQVTPMLFPYEPKEFWELLRKIVREEWKEQENLRTGVVYKTPGLVCKPLYKMKEVCSLLGVTRPTIYDWVRHGKLKPHKIRSRVYFLWDDIQTLLQPAKE